MTIVTATTESLVEPSKKYSAFHAALAAGISKSTLLRRIKQGKIKDAKRNKKGWRVFTEEDVNRLREMAN